MFERLRKLFQSKEPATAKDSTREPKLPGLGESPESILRKRQAEIFAEIRLLPFPAELRDAYSSTSTQASILEKAREVALQKLKVECVNLIFGDTRDGASFYSAAVLKAVSRARAERFTLRSFPDTDQFRELLGEFDRRYESFREARGHFLNSEPGAAFLKLARSHSEYDRKIANVRGEAIFTMIEEQRTVVERERREFNAVAKLLRVVLADLSNQKDFEVPRR